MTKASAIKAIERHGILLVFPLNNAREPMSIWSHFFPRTKMVWDWDDAPTGVVDLWHLREELSRSRKVVYAKWYQGRATFFSRPVFTACTALLHAGREPRRLIDSSAAELLASLAEDSPQSTKALKARARDEWGWAPKDVERSLKTLWSLLLIVGFGEVDDGAFPSLAVGATDVLFEELSREARRMSPEKAEAQVRAAGLDQTPFYRQLQRLRKPRTIRPARGRTTEISFEELTGRRGRP